jgi:hypothetical protein
MRMPGLCKVEMSAFTDGRGRPGDRNLLTFVFCKGCALIGLGKKKTPGLSAPGVFAFLSSGAGAA